MIFEKGTKLYSYQVQREAGENVVYINYLGAPYIPSIAKFPEVMARAVDLIIESPNVSRIILVQQRNYNYGSDKVNLLSEIANLYLFLINQEKILSLEKLSSNSSLIAQRHAFMTQFMQLLKQDPAGAYRKIKTALTFEK